LTADTDTLTAATTAIVTSVDTVDTLDMAGAADDADNLSLHRSQLPIDLSGPSKSGQVEGIFLCAVR
jgi:hypothetical protein